MRHPSHVPARQGRSPKKRQRSTEHRTQHPSRSAHPTPPATDTHIPLPSQSLHAPPRQSWFTAASITRKTCGMIILVFFLLLYLSGYYSVSSFEHEPFGEDGEVEQQVQLNEPKKHFLLQPPGENNGNVLPGAVLVDSKTFDGDNDQSVKSKRDDNTLPGAIGLMGAFDEHESEDIMGNASAAASADRGNGTSPDAAPAKSGAGGKASKEVGGKPHSTKSENKSADDSTKEKKKKKKKKKKRKRKKSKKSDDAESSGGKPTTSETPEKEKGGVTESKEKSGDTPSASDKSDKKNATGSDAKVSAEKKDAEKSASDGKDQPSTEGKAENAMDSKEEKGTEPSGPLYDGPHPMNRQMTELQVPGDGDQLDEPAVKSHYEKLVKAYLAPFSEGIPRKSFFKILKRRTYSLAPPGSNKGIQTLLFQLHDKKVHLLDPYEVAKNSKPFYKTRIQELIWLLSDIAKGDMVPNTEFLVAIHDCVQTVNHDHSYRGSVFKESSPTFTIVSCNFSDNIPFPMWEGDPVRGGLKNWDNKMEKYRSSDATPWAEKQNKAVFRGGNRPSMYFKQKKDANEHCDEVGRTRIAYLGEKNTNLFDVGVSGKCGGKTHSMEHLSEVGHHAFKYILYAEGNCFWADRLNKQVFGPSAVIKQETPCGQFWEPLLKPMTHYIPTNFFFSDTVSQIEWAKDNDEKVKEIVAKANDFAKAFLSFKGIKTYTEVLLVEYTKLLKSKDFEPEKGSKDVTI